MRDGKRLTLSQILQHHVLHTVVSDQRVSLDIWLQYSFWRTAAMEQCHSAVATRNLLQEDDEASDIYSLIAFTRVCRGSTSPMSTCTEVHLLSRLNRAVANPKLSSKGGCRALAVHCVAAVCGRWTPAMQPTVTSARNSRMPPSTYDSGAEWALGTRVFSRKMGFFWQLSISRALSRSKWSVRYWAPESSHGKWVDTIVPTW
jgi:hypothetical protein